MPISISIVRRRLSFRTATLCRSRACWRASARNVEETIRKLEKMRAAGGMRAHIGEASQVPTSRKRSAARQQQAREADRPAEVGGEEAHAGAVHAAACLRLDLAALGIVVGITHWLAHLSVLYEDKAIWDLTIGYPTAGILGIARAIVLSN